VTLLKTSALNAAAVVVRIVAALGVNKVLAVYLGPAGYTLVAQLGNVAALLGAVTGAATGSGVTKYTAEHADSPLRQRATWRAATHYLLAATAAASIAVIALNIPLASWLLGSAQRGPVLIALALVLPMMSFNALLLAILNGKKDVRTYVLQGICSVVLSAGATATLAAVWGLTGALAAVVVGQALSCGITLWLCVGRPWMTRDSFVGPLERSAFEPLVGYAAMAMVSAVAAPLGQLGVRDQLINQFGVVGAGEWQAIFKISEIYVQLFTATFGLYYLPRLAEIRFGRELWREIAKVSAFVLPIAVASALTIYAAREWITLTLFTAEFRGMVQLFGWQLVGDVLKVGSWVFGFVLVGRAMVRWFIVLEIVFVSSWVCLTGWLTDRHGIGGAPMAYALNYVAYWIVTSALVWREARRMDGQAPMVNTAER
jgi:polysaccharide transporter, PST family